MQDADGRKTASWVAAWYDLDYPIAVGLRQAFDFYVDPATAPFLSGVVPHPLLFAHSTEARKVEIEVTIDTIRNAELGDLRGILPGLDYCFVTSDGRAFKVEAEQDPGFVYAWNRKLRDVHFEVLLSDLRFTAGKVSARRRRLRRADRIREEKASRAQLVLLLGEYRFVEA